MVTTILAPFLVTIVALVATDYFHLPLGFIATAKAQRTNPNKIAAFRDTLHNVAMAVLAMNDVMFPCHDGSSEGNKNAQR